MRNGWRRACSAVRRRRGQMVSKEEKKEATVRRAWLVLYMCDIGWGGVWWKGDVGIWFLWYICRYMKIIYKF